MNPTNLSPQHREEARADWETMLSRHLMLANLPQATREEAAPHWESRQTPLQAAHEIALNRDRADPQGECA